MRGLGGMDEPPPIDPGSNARMLRNIGIAAFAALTLGSCGGMALGHYTITGMAPFDEPASPSYLATDDAPARANWFEIGADQREAMASRY